MKEMEEILSLNDLVLAFINGQDVVHMDGSRSGTVNVLERVSRHIEVHIKADVPNRIEGDGYTVLIPAKGNSRVRGFHIRTIFPRINESRDI